MVIFAWRDKELKVDSHILEPFMDAEITAEANLQEKTSGTETAVSLKSLKPVNFSMTVQLLHAAGVNVQDEMESWQSRIDGAAGRIYLGGKDMIGKDMILTGCPASEMVFAGDGTLKAAKLQLTFQQYGVENKKTSSTKKSGQDRLKEIAEKEWKSADPTTYTALTAEQIAAMREKATAATKAVTDAASRAAPVFESAFGPAK